MIRASSLTVVSCAVVLASTISFGVAAQAPAKPAERGLTGGNIAHGRYIAERVAMCIECHSPRDSSGQILSGSEYLGAPLPIQASPEWATRAPRNRGLLAYSDDQALRLLMNGAIGRDGGQLKSPMPRFRMSREDATDVIAFMRSLR